MAASDPSTSNRDVLTSGPVSANPFIFPTGDVKTLVTCKGVKIEGLVSSQSLCQASHAWKNLIYPLWDISGQGNVVGGTGIGLKDIDCSEDDGEALLVLMGIVYLKFIRVPKHLGVHELAQVYFWGELEIENNEYFETIGPCWTFGWELVFEYLMERLVSEVTLSDEGQPVDGCGKQVVGFMPPGCLVISTSYDACGSLTRLKAIEMLLASAYTEISRHESDTDIVCKSTMRAASILVADGVKRP
ncbi:hypothetical protein IFR05_014745 [Cadophora sp. M221]|nr:hypothetical protein IFR05_014745 [Cadophora sp. M221]